jgi:WD repeat-containing protein 35
MASKYAVTPKKDSVEEEAEKKKEDDDVKSEGGKSVKSGDDDDDEDETMIFKYTKKNEDGSQEHIEEEWSVEHAKILYLMSKYAKAARKADDAEGWIRQIPLLVLLYEGIEAGKLDFDYAPCSMLISQDGRSRRVWLNITQEGKAAVDDLREKELINGLKLSTEDFQPVTAFQVSLRGLELCDQLGQEYKAVVDEYTTSPDGHLLQVKFVAKEDPGDGQDGLEEEGDGDDDGGDGDDDDDDDEGAGTFFMCCPETSFERESGVTDTEDVSYVSSPYLPSCVRNPRDQRAFTSNAHRKHESAQGNSNIRDELDEAVTLAYVHVMVGEWIPFGSNQIVALNERLGAMDRCQGGLFTAVVDKHPTQTQFDVPPGLTQVTILDYDFVRFINFEAEINYPEEDGIVQVENFGIHLNVDGTVLYGMKIEAILDRTEESVSVDHLARLLVDVHQDTSQIMNDLLSAYQRSLLDMIFMGDMDQRGKFNMLISEGIEPFQPAEEYMDREDKENELKQVLGDLHKSFDLGEDGVLIVGRDGILVAGANAGDCEELLVCYLSLLCREMFIRNFFTRTFVMDDLLKRIRRLILSYQEDPNHIPDIRLKINDASRDIILLTEILSYLLESLVGMSMPDRPKGKIEGTLFDRLDVKQQLHDVTLRATDLEKLVHGASHELNNLQQMTDVINTKQLEDVFKNVEANTKYLVDASAANERASASLEVMQVILAGSFAFDIVDRLSGGTLNITVPDWVNSLIVDPIISVPMLWFFINMVWLLCVSIALMKLMAYLGEQANGALTVRVKINKKIDVKKLEAFIRTRNIEVTDAISEPHGDLKKATWQETDKVKWQGEPPKIEAQYNETYGFLLAVTFSVNARNTELDEGGLLGRFIEDMRSEGILVADDLGPMLNGAVKKHEGESDDEDDSKKK